MSGGRRYEGNDGDCRVGLLGCAGAGAACCAPTDFATAIAEGSEALPQAARCRRCNAVHNHRDSAHGKTVKIRRRRATVKRRISARATVIRFELQEVAIRGCDGKAALDKTAEPGNRADSQSW
jgi:hypothetical protein